MKKSLRSFIRVNRKPFFLLGIVLSLVVFGTVSWTISAQDHKRGRADNPADSRSEDIFELQQMASRLGNAIGVESTERERAKVDQIRGRIAALQSDSEGSKAESPPNVKQTPKQRGPCAAQNTLFWAYNFSNDHLVRFTAANPTNFLSDIQLTGLAADEFLLGIDYRPSTATLYGLVGNFIGTRVRVVAINSSTGELFPIGQVSPPGGDVFLGVDFNPVPDLIRAAGDAESNRRFNPNTGALAGTDTNLAYVAGDPSFGTNPNVVHVAYTNSQPGATMTTLYGIDSGTDRLVRIGGPDGVPSPNTGQLTSIGLLGVNTTSFGGFDIQPFTNAAYAALRIGGVEQLFSINLATGAATMLGMIGNGTNEIDGLAVAPCVTAAGVEVSGRVMTPDGRGLRNATVSITDAAGIARTATTSTFGYYRFDDVQVGETYVMSVASRRYRYAPRAVLVIDKLTDVDFVGEE